MACITTEVSQIPPRGPETSSGLPEAAQLARVPVNLRNGSWGGGSTPALVDEALVSGMEGGGLPLSSMGGTGPEAGPLHPSPRF